MPVTGVITQIRTTNLEESIDFYTSLLGLELDFRYEDFYAAIKAGDNVFHLKLVDKKDPSIKYVSESNHLHLYFTTPDVEDKANQLQANGITLLSEVSEKPWGTKEFSVNDNQGHVIYFGQG